MVHCGHLSVNRVTPVRSYPRAIKAFLIVSPESLKISGRINIKDYGGSERTKNFRSHARWLRSWYLVVLLYLTMMGSSCDGLPTPKKSRNLEVSTLCTLEVHFESPVIYLFSSHIRGTPSFKSGLGILYSGCPCFVLVPCIHYSWAEGQNDIYLPVVPVVPVVPVPSPLTI